ncbi:MAG: heavy metal-binding domain-containing protein [Marmoricola sp.]
MRQMTNRTEQHVVGTTGSPAGPGTGGTTQEVAAYTCPMHPEVRQPGPGACPIAGADVFPTHVTDHVEPDARVITDGWTGYAASRSSATPTNPPVNVPLALAGRTPVSCSQQCIAWPRRRSGGS